MQTTLRAASEGQGYSPSVILATAPTSKINRAVISRTPKMDQAIGRSFSKNSAAYK